MNKVILMGRLTKAPKIKYLQDDNKTAMARYTLAVDWRYGKDREREADFISCVTFGKNAEFAELYLKKGTKIVISGRIRTGNYTDSEGVKRYSRQCCCRRTFFAESKKASDTDPKDEKDGFMSVPEDAELPFE
ncbi:MAG: single-stranded DNA-binding protein [Mediterraneibacter gnavus]